MPASVSYTFSPGTQIESAKVNQNFDDLVNHINGELVPKDGTVAFTGLVTGPATDPSGVNHLARKAYVDGKVGLLAKLAKTTDSNATGSSPSIADMGIDMPDWTMPTIANGRAVRICLAWPYSILVNQSGNPDLGTHAAEVWIRINGTNQQQYKIPITTTAFTPGENTGGTFDWVITSNSTFTAGTTMTCKVMGRRVNPGGLKLGADASNTINYYAHII